MSETSKTLAVSVTQAGNVKSKEEFVAKLKTLPLIKFVVAVNFPYTMMVLRLSEMAINGAVLVTAS